MTNTLKSKSYDSSIIPLMLPFIAMVIWAIVLLQRLSPPNKVDMNVASITALIVLGFFAATAIFNSAGNEDSVPKRRLSVVCFIGMLIAMIANLAMVMSYPN